MNSPLAAVLNILAWEQLRLRAYKDAVGKDTIGWGHLMRPGDAREITREAANRLFMEDLAKFEREVDRLVAGRGLKPYQFGALVSFAFNVGIGNFSSSTMLKLIKEGKLDMVADQFKRWVYGTDQTGKKVMLQGLVERRAAETRLWLGAD